VAETEQAFIATMDYLLAIAHRSSTPEELATAYELFGPFPKLPPESESDDAPLLATKAEHAIAKLHRHAERLRNALLSADSLSPPSAEELGEIERVADKMRATEPKATIDPIIPPDPPKPLPAEAKAFASYLYAVQAFGNELKDDAAYEWIKENGIDTKAYPDFAMLEEYRLPAKRTWLTYLIKGRSAAGQKKMHRERGEAGGALSAAINSSHHHVS
jgi:hypothetical protein